MQHSGKKKGFNLIEVATVLGVVGLVVGAIWVGAAMVMEKMRVSSTVKNILYTAQMLSQNFTVANGNSFNGTMTHIGPYAINAKLVPADWIYGNSLKDAWGHNISMSAPASFPATPRIDLTFWNTTPDQCKGLLLGLSQAAQNPSIMGVWLGSQGTWVSLPTPVHQIDSTCTMTQNVSIVVKIEK